MTWVFVGLGVVTADSQVCSHFHPLPCDSSPKSPPPMFEESPLVSEVPFTLGSRGSVFGHLMCSSPGQRAEMAGGHTALLNSRCSFSTYCVPGMSLNSKIHSEQNKVSVLLKLGPQRGDRWSRTANR